MNNHEAVELNVADPVLPAADVAHALSMAREQALDATASRVIIVTAAAVEVERWCGRLLWRGEGGAARRYRSAQVVADPSRPLSIAPNHPDAADVEAGPVVVEIWTAGAWVTDTANVDMLPGGRVRVARPGTYRVTVDLTPPTPAPVNAIEGMARLFGLRETRRSGDDDGAPVSLGNAVLRSGAGEVLRPLRRWLSV